MPLNPPERPPLSAFAARCAAIDIPWQSLEKVLGQALDSNESSEARPIMCFLGQPLDAWSWRMADALARDAEVCELVRSAFTAVYADALALSGPAALCQQVLALSAGASGWPTLLFLLPDGRPFGAIPYSPMRDADRRSGLATILVQIAETWLEQPEALAAGAAALGEQLAILQQLPSKPQRSSTLILEACESACCEAADSLEGGFGDIPRHFHFAALHFMLQRVAQGAASERLSSQLFTTLNAYIAGGVHDQLGGGFHRAAQDRSWDLPFFEKRCGDQAQLAAIFSQAAELSGIALYADIAERCVEWMLDHLPNADGWFQHGLHALCGGDGADGGADESAGPPSEGGTYAWSPAAVAALVGSDGGARFARRFLSGPSLDQHFHIPSAKGPLAAGDEEALPEICARLALARNERPQPWANQQVVLAEQGMALVALGQLLDQQPDNARWLQAARALSKSIGKLVEHQPTMCTVLGSNQAADSLTLAWLGLGWWRIHRHLDLPANLARQWAAALWAQRRRDGSLPIYPNPTQNGGALPGDDLPAVLDSDYSPSACSVAAQLFAELSHDDPTWATRSAEFIELHRPLMGLSPFAASGLCARLMD